MKGFLDNRCYFPPLSYAVQADLKLFTSAVPQPQTSLVTAPFLAEGTYVGVKLVCAQGVTYQWGATHQLNNMRLGLSDKSSFRPWLELTPFEKGFSLDWAKDVILEYHSAGLPLSQVSGWWALPRSYHSTGADMTPEPALMTGSYSDRATALSLAQAFLSSEPPATSQGIGPCTNSASNPCSGTGSGPITRQWSGDYSSDTGDTNHTDSDSDPEDHRSSAAAPLTALSVPDSTGVFSNFVWQPTFSRGGTLKQTCPVCPSAFGCGPDTRPDCTDRGRKYVILAHSQSKGDSRHLALAESIQAADPDFNNFRTSQVAPGCVAGPDNWVFHTDENWARYFTQYTHFKRKSLRNQRTALTNDHGCQILHK